MTKGRRWHMTNAALYIPGNKKFIFLFIDNQFIQVKECRLVILNPVQTLIGIGLLYHMTLSLQKLLLRFLVKIPAIVY